MSVSAEQVRLIRATAKLIRAVGEPGIELRGQSQIIVDADDYITELVRVARRAKVLLKKEWLGTQLQEDIAAALAKYRRPTDED